LWFAPAFLLLSAALVGSAADNDPYGDPLPTGAKARLGTARLRVETTSPPVLTPDGKSLYALTGAGILRLDPLTGAPQGKSQGGFGGIGGISADGKRVAQVGFDGVTVWDVGSGKSLVKVQRRLPGSTAAVALSADGKTLVLGGANEFGKQDPVTILVWGVDADKEMAKIAVPQNQWANVAVSGDGKTVASWGTHLEPEGKGNHDPEKSLNRFVHFWDAATGKELSKFRSSGFAPAAVAVNQSGSLAAVSDNNGGIDLVDPKTGTSKALLLGRIRIGQWIAFSPDGATVAATGEDGAVQRWKVADGTRLSTTEPPAAGLFGTGVRLLSNEKGIAWAKKGLAVVVWEIPSGKLLTPAGGHTSPVVSVAVSADGTSVLTSGVDGLALKWELATGKPAGAVTLRQPNGAFAGYAYAPPAQFSPDLTRALRDAGGGLGIHDAATGSQEFVIPVPPEGYSNGSFTADGSKVVVATASYDTQRNPSRVAVWDVRAGKRVFAIDLPGYGTAAAAVTPDGKHVVTAGRKPSEKGNGTFVVTAWDAATGAKKGELTEEAGFTAPQVATAADNKTAAVVTAKGALVAFDLASGKIGKTYDTNRRVPAIAPVFSPDGKTIAVATQAGYDEARTASVLVLDWATGATKHTFTLKGGNAGAVAFSPDGKWLVTGSPDTTALVWDLSK
jgi:WD40 repeat protein